MMDMGGMHIYPTIMEAIFRLNSDFLFHLKREVDQLWCLVLMLVLIIFVKGYSTNVMEQGEIHMFSNRY